ncbi:MAG: hypothetical protein Q8K70_01880 [Bacteroidota bacterium]|nr:hypothetical protein [Bacteroidota bacterium]
MIKKINYMAFSVALFLSVTACTNQTKKTETQNFVSYVDSINQVDHTYTVENWESINNEYNQRIALLEQEIANMNEDEKAKLEESKAKYAALKTTYETKIAESNQANEIDSKYQLRNRLFGENVITEDLQFAFVNATNALNVFETFVNTVDANKDAYSRENWDEIKVLYEALNTRKNAIEKDLAGSDNRQIAVLKVKFASIYSIIRPMSKVDENAEAKR